MTSKFLTCSKSEKCIVKTRVKIIDSKMLYSESEPDSNFAVNSASDFDSDSEFDSNSAFMNFVIFVFFILCLHSSKKNLQIVFLFYSHNRINSYPGNASIVFVFFCYFIT